jgi:hypothetical protein
MTDPDLRNWTGVTGLREDGGKLVDVDGHPGGTWGFAVCSECGKRITDSNWVGRINVLGTKHYHYGCESKTEPPK